MHNCSCPRRCTKHAQFSKISQSAAHVLLSTCCWEGPSLHLLVSGPCYWPRPSGSVQQQYAPHSPPWTSGSASQQVALHLQSKMPRGNMRQVCHTQIIRLLASCCQATSTTASSQKRRPHLPTPCTHGQSHMGVPLPTFQSACFVRPERLIRSWRRAKRLGSNAAALALGQAHLG